jgi:hypothetical protein
MHLTEFAKALDKILDVRDATGIRVTHETLRGWAAEWAREDGEAA